MNWQKHFTEAELKEIERCRAQGDLMQETTEQTHARLIAKLVELLTAVPSLTPEALMDQTQLIAYLRRLANEENTQAAFAKDLGISATLLSLVLNGYRTPSGRLLKTLGLKALVHYVPDQD